MKKIYLSFIIGLLLASCSSLKTINESNVEQFFSQWHDESQQIILKNKEKGSIQQNINEILALHLCQSKSKFPNLKYHILTKNIKVSMYKTLGLRPPSEDDLIFSQVDFKHSLECNTLKTLIFTPKYAKILTKKLPYGFADQTQKSNEQAQAMLVKMGDDLPYEIPAQIYINFNQSLDRAMLFTYREGSFGVPYYYLFHLENGVWKADGVRINLTIP
ncbi:MAG: hypothetical protein CSA42_03315 [Gammaproteobacteria bacterium]|nr:MAG: hypothetical protein CSA42_03315 [Gammaproteobacteria bacterium]